VSIDNPNGIIKLPGPWRITFDTNPDTCNLHCIMCEEHSIYNKRSENKHRLMDFTIIKKVIESASRHGLKEIIPSTMGEPLLYPQFEDIIDIASKKRLKINLTTNGTFSGRPARDWAIRILPVISDVKVSINGSNVTLNESIMNGINMNQQLENIRELITFRDELKTNGSTAPTITFQVTYMEQNLNDLPDLLKLAIDMRVDRFKGHHLWVTNDAMITQDLRRNEDAISRWNKIVDRLNDIRNDEGNKSGHRIKLDNVYKIANRKRIGNPVNTTVCPFLGREAWIAWDGTFNVCCAPDELRKSFGDFGNVNQGDFMDLWNSNKYDALIKSWGSSKLCQRCNMRRPLRDLKGC